MESPYSQATLDLSGSSFRLIELQPCGPTEVIKCRLTTHPLPPGCPSYVALSYMWDHESTPDTIMLNNVPFQVGHSLWTFLNQMRLHQKFGTYWIDGLCIDQSNVLERNHQVQIMECIYSEASSVSIWLGEAEEGSTNAEAMDLMASLEDKPHSYRDWTPRQIEVIKDFSKIAYWRRMWIVQEVVLAKKPIIYCGPRMLKFCLLASLMLEAHNDGFDILWTLVLSPADTLRICVEKLTDDGIESKFGTAMLYCESREAFDPRDKIYALLGVLGKEVLSIPVDYHIAIEELWAIAFSCICRTQHRSESLSHMQYLAEVTQKSLGIECSTEDVSKKIINKVFLTRSPPAGMRELLELPDVPNEAVYFETNPTFYNPRGLLAVEQAHEARMRAKAGTLTDPRVGHKQN